MTNAQKPAPVREFKAHAKDKTSAFGASPRAAALAFFAANPNARKCNVIEGATEYTDGVAFFVVKYGRASAGDWPQSFKEVTKKTADALPDVDPNEAQKV